jgi:hypothetical protein
VGKERGSKEDFASPSSDKMTRQAANCLSFSGPSRISVSFLRFCARDACTFKRSRLKTHGIGKFGVCFCMSLLGWMRVK